MRVAVTGTPGTGKTTATELLDTSLDVIHLNDVIQEKELVSGHDTDRDSLVVDLEAVSDWLEGRDDVVFESHLAHQFDADRVVVCRCHPEQLEKRLEERGASEESIGENAESEALDIILSEAVDRHGMNEVYEIETTERTPREVADEVSAVIGGEREPNAGTVSYVDYL